MNNPGKKPNNPHHLPQKIELISWLAFWLPENWYGITCDTISCFLFSRIDSDFTICFLWHLDTLCVPCHVLRMNSITPLSCLNSKFWVSANYFICYENIDTRILAKRVSFLMEKKDNENWKQMLLRHFTAL